MEGTADKLFPLLRIAQIQTALGQFEEAWSTLEQARAVSERVILDIGRAGLSSGRGDPAQCARRPGALAPVLELQAQVKQMVAEISSRGSTRWQPCARLLPRTWDWQDARQMTAEQDEHRRRPSSVADGVGHLPTVRFHPGGGVPGRRNPLSAQSGPGGQRQAAEAHDFLSRAYAEMMRKHDLIPPDSPFRRTFLENIVLHRQIRVAYAGQTQSEQCVIRSGE